MNDMKVREWVKRCQELIHQHYQKNFSNLETPKLQINPGKKYFKIVQVDNQRTVWAFVNKETLDILKPASWAAPAKHARGNILDKSNGMSWMTPYGPEYLR